MKNCSDCERPLTDADKNAAGHYRDRCQACLSAAAVRERHVETCEAASCLVCRSYREEFGAP